MDYEALLDPVLAPAPFNPKELVSLRIDRQLVAGIAGAGKRTKIFEMFYNICGVVPPVPGVGYHERESQFPDHFGGLKHARSLFRGIKRPFKADGLDGQIYTYIVRPRFVYEYLPHMVCVAKRYEAPNDTVLAVYVSFDDEKCEKGAILSWEWVPVDKRDPNLPENYANRYDERIW